MLINNNRIKNKLTKSKFSLLLGIIAVLGFISLISVGKTNAAITIPSGFRQISSGTGVRVFEKTYSTGKPDYVIVVDLRYATLRNFTGNVSGQQYYSKIERRLLRSFWDYAVSQNTSNRKAIAAINGTFFSTNEDPAPIAFGLKADWWRMSYGYEITSPTQTFAFDSSFGSSSIQSYNRATFDGVFRMSWAG